MKQLVLEGHLCQAGDGSECAYLMLDGRNLQNILAPHGVDVGNRKVERLPGAMEEATVWFERLQRNYGLVRMTIEFLSD